LKKNIDELLLGLQDIGTQTLLTASFAVTSASNLPWKNLPSIKKINSLFQV
jgi:hypothetical protein